jgi:hypothetical protein
MMIRPPDAVLAEAQGERRHFSQRIEPGARCATRQAAPSTSASPTSLQTGSTSS